MINHQHIDINALTDFGETPLHITSKFNHKDFCEILISVGACIDKRDNDMYSPLHYACEFGHKEVVQILIANKAST